MYKRKQHTILKHNKEIVWNHRHHRGYLLGKSTLYDSDSTSHECDYIQSVAKLVLKGISCQRKNAK